MTHPKAQCEVCFFTTTSSLKTAHMIVCRTCKRSAHQYCYLPEAQDSQFQCDVCAAKAKNPLCSICHNSGLLKRTQQGEYAHPVCLIFCKEALVKSYKQLSFYLLRSKRKSKSARCDICTKTTFLSDLFQCFERQCSKSAHYYCILKQQWKDTSETNKWVQEIRIFNNLNFNYLEFFYNKFKKYIKIFSVPAYRAVFGEAKIIEEFPVYITYCRDHCANLTNCFCIALEDANSKIDWVFCDVCGKWYHFHCEEIEEDSSLEENYTCTCCRNWKEKLTAQEEPLLRNFPRLHFYDLVYIQLYAEGKNYHLSAPMKDLLKRVPFTCSIKNFTENFKTREMVTRVLKNTNFMCVKKLIIDKSKNKKQLTKNLQKLDRDLISIIWKLDFIVSAEPIKAVGGLKNHKYKVEDILGIFQKYQKKHNQGSNIIKPAIKQLLKLRAVVKNEDEEESQKDSETIKEDIQQIFCTLKDQIEKIKKCGENIKQTYRALADMYVKLSENEFLKQLLKDYIKQNRPSFRIYSPLFIYQNESEMVIHTRMGLLLTRLNYFLEKDSHQHSRHLLVSQVSSLYSSSSPKVQAENIRLIRIIQSSDHEQENFNNLLNLRDKFILSRQTKTSLQSIFEANNRKQSYTLQQTQNSLDRFLQAKFLDNFFASLHLKTSSLTRIYRTYPRVKQCMKELAKESLIESFLKMYQNAKKLIEGFYETSFIEEEKLDADMIQVIKNIKIDRSNIYRFCTFFTEICQYSLQGLNPSIEKAVVEKGEQYLSLISSRSMVFQCQIEFKAASVLLKKYPFKKPKVKELMNKNKQLQDILSSVTIDSLSDMGFLESNIQKLREAKEFCQENNLQFRISKIEYMMKLYQCKEDSFKYFPAQFVVKKLENVPKKYQHVQGPTRVDFYLLKKYIYKMKLLKYPQSDYLFMKLSAVYEEKEQYMNILSLIINNYNAHLANQQVPKLQPSFTKQQILALIKSKQGDIVTCQPQEDEIRIICDLYDDLLQIMQRKIKSNCVDITQMEVLNKKFEKFPFDPQLDGIYSSFSSYLKAVLSKRQKVANVQEERQSKLKKNQLDQTSARAQQSHRSITNIENLKKQIISKPRTMTIKQIESKTNELKLEGQSESLKQIASYSNKILKQNNMLITKFIRNQAFTRQDMVGLRKMATEYENQYVRVEIIEEILNQLKIFEKALIFNDCQESRKLLSGLNQSFYLTFYNKTAPIQNCSSPEKVCQAESKSESKSKKTKIVLKK